MTPNDQSREAIEPPNHGPVKSTVIGWWLLVGGAVASERFLAYVISTGPHFEPPNSTGVTPTWDTLIFLVHLLNVWAVRLLALWAVAATAIALISALSESRRAGKI